MTTIYHGPKDLAESLQALEDLALPADLQNQLSDVLRALDGAQDVAKVNHYLDVAGGLAAGLRITDGESVERAKRVNAIFEAQASHVRRELMN
ncbi:hypothetical protein [Pseudomonas guariconensis]|uniref:hypothetical protein n=1 Tax=Pseudomonas guariconensis TaxID=1288410 RepID=UPI00209BA7D5|nr:hypothetical protein [Pseudomonas guariconensis]MCO7623987.1 hypothetical protein [Pseudomonas guariconensis]